jgi:hypothetical protein
MVWRERDLKRIAKIIGLQDSTSEQTEDRFKKPKRESACTPS